MRPNLEARPSCTTGSVNKGLLRNPFQGRLPWAVRGLCEKSMRTAKHPHLSGSQFHKQPPATRAEANDSLCFFFVFFFRGSGKGTSPSPAKAASSAISAFSREYFTSRLDDPGLGN